MAFLLVFTIQRKRVVAINQIKNKKILRASQDGNWEFISLLAYICADGSAIPLGLIYQGESKDMYDTWLQDFHHSRDEAHFTVSSDGWTNDNIGFS